MAHSSGIIGVDRERCMVQVSPYPLLRTVVSRYYAIPRATLAPLTNEAILGLFIGMRVLDGESR